MTAVATLTSARRTGGRRQLLAALEACEGLPAELEIVALRPPEPLEAAWLLETSPRVPRRLAKAVRAAAAANLAEAYRVDRLVFAVLGGASMTPGMIATSVRADMERWSPGLAASLLHGTVTMPDEGSGRPALRLCLERVQARGRRLSLSTERQLRDVLLRLLAERHAGRIGGASARVSELAVRVGRKLGLTLDELDVLVRAAELQDIGKALLADHILDKRSSLTPDEWEQIRGHPLAAERILDAAPALAPVARLVRSCSERYDGSGYPDGLRGEDIPLGARVIAVCVAFDAMTTERPYRPAVPATEAVAELCRCAGAQFDPFVVATFCSVWSDCDTPARRRSS